MNNLCVLDICVMCLYFCRNKNDEKILGHYDAIDKLYFSFYSEKYK